MRANVCALEEIGCGAHVRTRVSTRVRACQDALVRVCVCVCMRVRLWACVCALAGARAGARTCVYACEGAHVPVCA